MARQILEPGQYDYIIISKDAERHYQREEAKHLPERFRFIAEFYQKIHEYPLTQELAPRAGHSRGPVVKIYRVTTDPPAAEKS